MSEHHSPGEEASRFKFGSKLMREVSRGFVDTSLEKRAEWMIKSSKIQEYLTPKIVYKDKLAGQVEKGVKVICLGAGKGHEIDEIDKLLPGSEIIGVDPHDFQTKPVQKRLETLAHKASYLPENVSAENMAGIADKSADGITLNFVLHHIDKNKQNAVMTEINRVLKDDGKLFVAEDLVDSEEERKKVEQIDRVLNAELSGDNPHNYKNIQEWQKFFDENGLEIVEAHEEKPDKVRHGFFVVQKKMEK